MNFNFSKIRINKYKLNEKQTTFQDKKKNNFHSKRKLFF